MFLQEAVEGLISQVKDWRVRLRPWDLRGLRLGGLRAEMGMGDSKGNTGEGQFKKWTQCSWRVNCMEQKSDTAVDLTPPNVARTHGRTRTQSI